MSTITIRKPAEFEGELQKYLYERSEEGRAVRVGEKETSGAGGDRRQVRVAVLARAARRAARGRGRRERGGAGAPLPSAEDVRGRHRRGRARRAGGRARERDPRGPGHLGRRGAAAPRRAGEARRPPRVPEREGLGALQASKSAEFNDDRLELIRAGEELEAELSGEPDPIARTEEEKQISLRELEQALAAASDAIDERWSQLREKWFDRLLGAERADVPEHAHVAWIRRLSPLEATYTKERSVEVCMSTLTDLGFDLENDRNVGSTSRTGRRSHRAPA